MPLPEDRISYLLEVFTSKTATAQEEQELMEWMEDAKEDSELKTYMQGLWSRYQPGTKFSHVNWDKMFDDIMNKEKVYTVAPEPKRIGWYRVAAAVIIVSLLIGGYFYLNNKPGKQVAKAPQEQPVKNDIAAPKRNKAILTLSDGSKIVLDSAANGSLAVQGNVKVVKASDGQIVYAGEATEVKYNTLTVPGGSKPVELQLADGSNVWLNVASSITYPTAFAGKERKVQITGEAYFEVAHNAAVPFVVQKDEVSIQVLGTHFNVNAYSDEGVLKATLLEGSVKVTKGSISKIIRPGEQAQVTQEGQINLEKNADVDQVMAWKNGLFSFKGADFETIMRQVSKWYDVDVVYKGKIPSGHYSGKTSRNLDISQMLKVIEESGIKFSIEGRKIIIKE